MSILEETRAKFRDVRTPDWVDAFAYIGALEDETYRLRVTIKSLEKKIAAMKEEEEPEPTDTEILDYLQRIDYVPIYDSEQGWGVYGGGESHRNENLRDAAIAAINSAIKFKRGIK